MATYRVAVTTTGAAGSATGSAQTIDLPLGSWLIGVRVDYHASAPATTDVTISETDGLGQTLLTLTDNNTDGVYYPVTEICDDEGTAITGSYNMYAVEGPLTVAVAGCDALTDAVVVTIQTYTVQDAV